MNKFETKFRPGDMAWTAEGVEYVIDKVVIDKNRVFYITIDLDGFANTILEAELFRRNKALDA